MYFIAKESIHLFYSNSMWVIPTDKSRKKITEQETRRRNIDLCNFISTIVFLFDSFSIAYTNTHTQMIWNFSKWWFDSFRRKYIFFIYKIVWSHYLAVWFWYFVYCCAVKGDIELSVSNFVDDNFLSSPFILSSAHSLIHAILSLAMLWEMLQLRDANEGDA